MTTRLNTTGNEAERVERDSGKIVRVYNRFISYRRYSIESK